MWCRDETATSHRTMSCYNVFYRPHNVLLLILGLALTFFIRNCQSNTPEMHLFSLHFFFTILGKICSGNGFCRYSDPSGNVLSACSIINPTCTASCACSPQSGYGGADCSINAEASSARDLLRYSSVLSCPPPFLLTTVTYTCSNCFL